MLKKKPDEWRPLPPPPPSSGAHGTCPTCYTLDTPLHRAYYSTSPKWIFWIRKLAVVIIANNLPLSVALNELLQE